MLGRDPAEFVEASQWTDVPAETDTLEDHVTEVVFAVLPSHIVGKERDAFVRLVMRVVRRLLEEERLGPAVDLARMDGRELLTCLIAEIIDAPNPRLMARCIDFAFELNVQLGVSETQIAKLEGCTKASVSLYAVKLKRTYLQRPAKGMKPESAIESYRGARIGKSSRGPRVEWSFSTVLKEAYATA